MENEDLELLYNEALRDFQNQYKIFQMIEDGVYKRYKLTPADVDRVQQAWNRFLPLRKKFKGF